MTCFIMYEMMGGGDATYFTPALLNESVEVCLFIDRPAAKLRAEDHMKHCPHVLGYKIHTL